MNDKVSDLIKSKSNLRVLLYTHKLLNRLKGREIDYNWTSTVKNVNTDIFLRLCDKYSSLGVVDLNTSIIICLKTSFQLRLTTGSWILAKFFSPGGKYYYRWVQIIVNTDLTSDQFCYVNQLLYHNLKTILGNFEIRICLRKELFIGNIYLVTRIFSMRHSKSNLINLVYNYKSSLIPPIAVRIEIALIDLPQVDFDINFEELLKYYFQLPKYVCRGDIISIPLLSTNVINEDRYHSFVPPTHVHFKVLKLNGNQEDSHNLGYLIFRDKTTLILKGNVNSKVPPINSDIQTLNEIIPPCLRQYYDQLCDIFDNYYRLYITDLERISEDDQSIDEVNSNNKFDIKNVISTGTRVLLIGPTGRGKTKLIKLLSNKYGYHIKWIDSGSVKGDTSAFTEAKIKQVISKIIPFSLVVFTNFEVLSEDRDGNMDPRISAVLQEEFNKITNSYSPPFIIATTYDENKMSDDLWSLFGYQIPINCPNQEERLHTLKWFLAAYFKSDLNNSKLYELSEEIYRMLSHRTAGFEYGDIEELVNRTHRLHIDRGVDVTASEKNHKSNLAKDFLSVLDDMQRQRSESLGLPQIPKVNWADVGGLEDAKKELINTIQLPIKRPDLISSSLRRTGILLHGPPGTGKTLLAKSVANECGLNFLSVKGPELLNMYVGQSEENVRQVFHKAKSATPCVIFFDELDSLAPNRGRSGDSGGVMDRIVSSLLAELDGVSTSSDLFVLAATNRPDLLDPALLRPGRFEKQIYLGPPDNNEEQLKILSAVTAKVNLSKEASLMNVVEKLPFTLTGADFSALVTDAFYIAVRRIIDGIKKGEASENSKVVVTESDLMDAAIQLVPSVRS